MQSGGQVSRFDKTRPLASIEKWSEADDRASPCLPAITFRIQISELVKAGKLRRPCESPPADRREDRIRFDVSARLQGWELGDARRLSSAISGTWEKQALGRRSQGRMCQRRRPVGQNGSMPYRPWRVAVSVPRGPGRGGLPCLTSPMTSGRWSHQRCYISTCYICRAVIVI